MLHRTEQDGAAASGGPHGDLVLLLEDDGIVALMIEDLAREHGAQHVMVCRRLADALDAAANDAINYAILDVAVWGASSYEVADALAARNIPFLFSTGMRPDDIAARHRHRPVLDKPFTEGQFRAAIDQLRR